MRDLDLMATTYPVGERRRVLANRGLAGIDGSVSTAIGAAMTRPGQRNLALLGDVTFLHDATCAGDRPRRAAPGPHGRHRQRRRRLDLRHPGAGRPGVPPTASSGSSEPPTGVDLAALCAATRTPHWRVESVPELRQALASPNGGIDVVEVRVRRDDRRALDEQIRGLVGQP